MLLFPEMRVTRKISTGRPQICFFNRFSGDIIFSSFVFFFLGGFLLVFFLKLKIYIPIHIRLCGRVSDKKNPHPADFRKQDYFFWPNY